MLTWDNVWKKYKGLNWFGRRLKSEEKRTLKKILKKLKLPKNSKIIDMGCGSGFSLNLFRNSDYENAIGIDNSRNAIILCKRLFNFIENKDIFLMNARETNFSNNEFDLVFSEGLLEHFKNPNPFVKEMCRLSKNWVLLIQPDTSSFFGKIKTFLPKITSVSWEREYSFNRQDYINMFKKFNFSLVQSGSINFNEVIWLLFKKSNIE